MLVPCRMEKVKRTIWYCTISYTNFGSICNNNYAYSIDDSRAHSCDDTLNSNTMKNLFRLFSTLLLSNSSDHSVHALAFSPQLQLPNFLNGQASTNKGTFSYTHLECNGQLWQVKSGNRQVSLVVDPLASQLDFGIPWGYRANKVSLTESQTIDLICNAHPSHCLLTMGLDDHCHPPTIRKMMDKLPELEYIVAPSCETKLIGLGVKVDKITVLRHGESCRVSDARVTATEGALVGPPWQKRENGFLLNFGKNELNEYEGLSIYYEPHGDVVLEKIKNLRADIMVSPVTKQALPAQVPSKGQFTLVYGAERTLEIADALQASVVIPLGNGVLNTEGMLAALVAASGGVNDLERLIKEKGSLVKVETTSPGVRVVIKI